MPEDLELALVQQLVVVRAQQYEVLEVRLAAIGPVNDVVRVQPAAVVAPRIAAGAVARLQRASHADRNRPAPSPYRQRRAVRVVDDPDNRPVAQESAHRWRRQVGSAALAAQHGFLDMHHHQVRRTGLLRGWFVDQAPARIGMEPDGSGLGASAEAAG